jgi:Raf kinase inhibitor-like YbhB/YbcL family protein
MKMLTIATAAVLLALFPAIVRAEPFTVTSPNFKDGEMLKPDQGQVGNDRAGRPCGGQDISPQLAWTGAPPETKSFAVSLIDIDGRKGAGVTHWLLYNIPPTVTSLPAGIGKTTTYTAGKNILDQFAWTGACAAWGDAPHHYVFTVFALDAPPTFPPGFDRDAFIQQVQSHTIRMMSIVGRYQRP